MLDWFPARPTKEPGSLGRDWRGRCSSLFPVAAPHRESSALEAYIENNNVQNRFDVSTNDRAGWLSPPPDGWG